LKKRPKKKSKAKAPYKRREGLLQKRAQKKVFCKSAPTRDVRQKRLTKEGREQKFCGNSALLISSQE